MAAVLRVSRYGSGYVRAGTPLAEIHSKAERIEFLQTVPEDIDTDGTCWIPVSPDILRILVLQANKEKLPIVQY